MLEFLIETFGISFVCQYLAGKGIDKVFFYKDREYKNFNDLLCESLENVFIQKKWEFDVENNKKIINDLIKNNSDKDICKHIIHGVLRDTFEELCDENFFDDWYKEIEKLLYKDEYAYFWKKNILSILKAHEKSIGSLNVDIKGIINENTELKKRIESITMQVNQDLEKEIKYALEFVENENYEKAIKCLTKISIEKEISIVFFNLGFCYFQSQRNLKGYKNALKYFFKSEKCNDDTKDEALLFYNIAMIYTHIADDENKAQNFEHATQYFEKVMNSKDDRDCYLIILSHIHMAKNIMDLCDMNLSGNILDKLYEALGIMSYAKTFIENLDDKNKFVLLHNISRNLYLISERTYDLDFLELSIKYYEKTQELECVKNNKENLALLLLNKAIAIQFRCSFEDDIEKKIKQAREARDIYKLVNTMHSDALAHFSRREKLNVKVNLAFLNASIERYGNPVNGFEKSYKYLEDCESAVNGDQRSLAKIYIKEIELAFLYNNTEAIEKAVEANNELNQILSILDNPKYKLISEIANYRLKFSQIVQQKSDATIDDVKQWIKEINKLLESLETEDNYNREILDKLLDDFEEVIRCCEE